jgi:hypothetical protein
MHMRRDSSFSQKVQGMAGQAFLGLGSSSLPTLGCDPAQNEQSQ